MMGTSEDSNREQGSRATFTLSSSFGLLLLAIMSAVSAARPHRVQHPTFADTPVNVTAVEGGDVILPCVVSGRGTKTIVWKKFGKATPITVGDFLFDPDDRFRTHHRPATAGTHSGGSHGSHPYGGTHDSGYGNHGGSLGAGAYGSGKQHHKSHNRGAQGSYDNHQDYGYPYDQSGKGYDDVYGNQGATGQYSSTGHYGNRFDPSLTEASNFDNPYWNLQIHDVQREDAGIYECQVTTTGNYGRNVTLHVTGEQGHRPHTAHRHGDKPEGRGLGVDRNAKQKKTGIELSGSIYVEKGSTIDLNCTATAIDYRPKGVDWFKDGIKIKAGPSVLITEWVMSETNVLHSRLEIERATMADAGTFICRFSTHHVESIKVIILNTDSPKNPRETASDGLRESKAHETNNPEDSAVTNGIHPFSTILAVSLTLLIISWT